MIQQLVESLPQVAHAVALPLSKTERIVMISGGGGDSVGAGASRLTRDVTNIIAQLPAVVEALTGIDILGALKSLPGAQTWQEQGSKQPASDGGSTPDVGASSESGD